MEAIWAKSGRTKTLVDHTIDVISAFQSMFGTPDQPSRLGDRWGNFFRLNNYQTFWNTTLASALFHDWGKANDGFQKAVLRDGEQLIWHEHLSALMLRQQSVHQWVSERLDIDWDVVLAAIMTHHLRVSRDGNDHSAFAASSPNGTLIEVFSSHNDFQQLLCLFEAKLGLTGEKPRIAQFWSFEGKPHCVDIVNLREELIDGPLRSFDKQVGGAKPRAPQRARLLRAVRSALIAADSVGSAMPRTGTQIEKWIGDAFEEMPDCTNDYVWENVLKPRIEELRTANKWNMDNGRNGWNEFQIETSHLPSRSLLLAPCGSGKTLAAWRWIAEQCKHPVKRIIFLYPTRATATEGFRDYVSWAPESDVALMHGTSDFDLQGMFENPESFDARSTKSFSVDPRLYSLAFWSRRVFSATVDQFLGFMQYAYSSILMLPLLADSVVVIDEVHSFDQSMFSVLKDFLKNFDVPVLCMTATLPEVRKMDLKQECDLELYDEKPGELHKVANADRYRVHASNESELLSLIGEWLSAGKRVLWVANQVKWVQKLVLDLALSIDANQLITHGQVPLFCYHSRFRLFDRRNRVEQTVRAFQGQKKPTLAITSTVCEMSLDMDADILVTQVSPITSLIQRMGRCNRVAMPRAESGDVYFYAPENEKPYSVADLEGTHDFLMSLVLKERVSQKDLENSLREFGPRAADIPKASNFLHSGPYALSGDESFRDIDQFTVPAILDCDIQEFHELRSRGKPTDGLVVPVPNQKKYFVDKTNDSEQLPRFLRVASSRFYNANLGFCDFIVSPEGVSKV